MSHRFTAEEVDKGLEIKKTLLINVRKKPFLLEFNISALTGIQLGIKTPIGKFDSDIMINVNHDDRVVISPYRSYTSAAKTFSEQSALHGFISMLMEFLQDIENSKEIQQAVLQNYFRCFQLDFDDFEPVEITSV